MQAYIHIYIEREREIYTPIHRDRERTETDTETETENITVQACFGLESFTANFRPAWGFFKACPVGLTDSYHGSDFVKETARKRTKRQGPCWVRG